MTSFESPSQASSLAATVSSSTNGAIANTLPPGSGAGTSEFPPGTWLGWGLDMTSAMPGDITSITQSIKNAGRLITISKNGEEVKFKSGVTWKVPNNVAASDDAAVGQSNYTAYETGTSAFSSFQGDASLSIKFMAVQASASVSASLSKMFNNHFSYSFYSYNANMINAFFDGWAKSIDEESLLKFTKNIPKFDSGNTDIIGSYKNFFKAFGTHTIIGTSYGARFQLNVWASNSDSTTKESFSLNVAAEYNGLTNGGKFDADLKKTTEYKNFQKSVQKTCSCQGGDTALAAALSGSPNDDKVYDVYQDWIKSATAAPGVMTMQTVAIWEMLSVASDSTLAARAADFENAYRWIVKNPATHKTKCRFTVNSDWGELGLLTPSAYIQADPNSPVPADWLMSPTKVSWGVEHSRKFERQQTIDFIIINEGSPVDIMLSHGSDGDTAGSGKCAVSMVNKNYENTGIKGNNWNSQWFYQCDVDDREQ